MRAFFSIWLWKLSASRLYDSRPTNQEIELIQPYRRSQIEHRRTVEEVLNVERRVLAR